MATNFHVRVPEPVSGALLKYLYLFDVSFLISLPRLRIILSRHFYLQSWEIVIEL
jgi:hypothetical protein